MRVSLRKIEKVLKREVRAVFVVTQPDAASVQRFAREHGVDWVSAAYSLGRRHGAVQLSERVLAWFARFGRNQMVTDAYHIVRQLTSTEFDELVRRHYDAAH